MNKEGKNMDLCSTSNKKEWGAIPCTQAYQIPYIRIQTVFSDSLGLVQSQKYWNIYNCNILWISIQNAQEKWSRGKERMKMVIKYVTLISYITPLQQPLQLPDQEQPTSHDHDQQAKLLCFGGSCPELHQGT